MILADYGDGLFKVLFLGHMLSFVIAFAPAVINPILAAKVKSADGEETLVKVAGHLYTNGRYLHLPALVAIGGFGLAMVFWADPVFAFDQAWVSLSFLVWLAIAGIVTAVMMPGERKMAAGDLSTEQMVAVGGQVVTLLTLLMLYLMIWKPGL